MGAHGVGIGLRQHKPSGLAQRRTNRAEVIGRGVALIGRLTRSCALAGPLPYPTVLLAKPHLVLPPQFQHYVLEQMLGAMGKILGEVFFERLEDFAALPRMAWTV